MRPKRRILLIDDNEAERSCTRVLLETRGYLVITAGGHEGLDRFWSVQAELVLVRAEPAVPGALTGYQLTEAIKRLSPATPVILYSRTRISTVELDHLADRYLRLPWSAFDLLETMRLLLLRKRGPKPKLPLFEQAEGKRPQTAAIAPAERLARGNG